FGSSWLGRDLQHSSFSSKGRSDSPLPAVFGLSPHRGIHCHSRCNKQLDHATYPVRFAEATSLFRKIFRKRPPPVQLINHGAKAWWATRHNGMVSGSDYLRFRLCWDSQGTS